MARKARSYTGNPPEGEGDMWVKHPLLLRAEDGTKWALYIADRNTPWPRLKLCAVGWAKNKGNYWLAWSHSKARFVRSREAGLLHQHRPDLYAALESRLQRESIGL